MVFRPHMPGASHDGSFSAFCFYGPCALKDLDLHNRKQAVDRQLRISKGFQGVLVAGIVRAAKIHAKITWSDTTEEAVSHIDGSEDIQELAPFILHFDFQLFRLAPFCVARLALDEVCTCLSDLHVLKSVFRATGLHPGFPTFAQFCRESVLYLHVSPIKRFAKLYYVGSTEGCMSLREASRYRKFKQVQQDKLVSAGQGFHLLAMGSRAHLFWCPPNILRGRGQAMIQTLQPPLNFPVIARWFCPKKGIIRPPNASQAEQIGFQRILRKRRRKLLLAQSPHGLPLPLNAIFDTPTFRAREATWVLLTQLGSNTAVNFEASKRPRSSEFSYPALCALHSVAKHLPAYMSPQTVRNLSLHGFRVYFIPGTLQHGHLCR